MNSYIAPHTGGKQATTKNRVEIVEVLGKKTIKMLFINLVVLKEMLQ